MLLYYIIIILLLYYYYKLANNQLLLLTVHLAPKKGSVSLLSRVGNYDYTCRGVDRKCTYRAGLSVGAVGGTEREDRQS
jgi:hypothetical protein